MSEQPLNPRPIEEDKHIELLETHTAPDVPAPSEVADSLGATAVENVPAAEDRPDVSKAWDMAHAGKEFRDNAAMYRSIASEFRGQNPDDRKTILEQRRVILDEEQKKLEELNREYADVDPDSYDLINFGHRRPANPRESEYFEKRADIQVERENKMEVTPFNQSTFDRDRDGMLDGERADYAGETRNLAPDINEHTFDEWAESAEEQAKDEDEYAKRFEEWTGILHDQPPTEAFKKQFDFDDEDLDARTLVSIEDTNEAREKNTQAVLGEIDEILQRPAVILGDQQVVEQLLDKVMSNTILMGDTSRDTWRARLANGKQLMTAAYGEESEELIGWQAMSIDSNVTLGQLQEKYKEAFHALVKPEIIKDKVILAVLEQIRNGNASRWQ